MMKGEEWLASHSSFYVKEVSMKKNIRETVYGIVSPTVSELGYSIWDITYAKVGADYHLEITIDSPSGLNIEDCERVHRAIDPLLDDADPIEGFYYLDVSSPGVERELRRDEHILAMIDSKVEARFFTQKDGAKSVVGILKGLSGDNVLIEEDGEVHEISKSDISKLTTVFFDKQ